MDAYDNKFWEGFSPEGKECLLRSMVLEGYPDRSVFAPLSVSKNAANQ